MHIRLFLDTIEPKCTTSAYVHTYIRHPLASDNNDIMAIPQPPGVSQNLYCVLKFPYMPYSPNPVSSHIRSVLDNAHPPIQTNVIFKSAVTRCKRCIAITPSLTFILIWLGTRCAYTRRDTVYWHSISVKSGT